MNVQVHHRENLQCWIEDEMVHAYYMHGCILTLEFAKELVALRLSLQGGKDYPIVAYVEDSVVINPDARKYLAKEGYNGVSKVALITNSKIKTVFINIFISIDRPPKPTKLFTDKMAAIRWIKENK